MQDPLSIRVDRPYVTEEAFLEAEAWSVNARSMLLIDIDPIPEGTALRCELRLSNGHALIVAEGYAVKHLNATATRPSGLVVRYKRMSAASTEFVKRAVAYNAESKAGSSPLAAPVPMATQTRPPPASSRSSVTPAQAPSVPPRASSRPAQAPSVPPRASSRPAQMSSVQPPPLPARSPVGLPSMKPPVPVRKSSKPPSIKPPHSTSVLPSAIRASTIPPSIVRRSSAPASSVSAPNSQSSLRPLEADGATIDRRSGSAFVDAGRADQTHRSTEESHLRAANSSSVNVPASTHAHDTDAMQRLRSRIPAKPISAPPDRETVLSRLKNKPIA
ncbi:MAG TPA: hypothetical protein VIV60_27760 [Polyangiaceae bacterium]